MKVYLTSELSTPN